MKKYVSVVLLIIFLIPFNVNAVKLGTQITGNTKLNPGSTVVYTVIVDQPLNNYKAEVIYDRNVLNLVDVNEVNINTTTKKFEVDKSNSIKVNIESDELSNIIYTIEFKVKEQITTKNTQIEVKTLLSKNKDEEFSLDENYIDIDFEYKESDDSEFLVDDGSKKYKKIVNSVVNVLNNYGNPILYGSLALNILLMILLISSIRRKKVDYDF